MPDKIPEWKMKVMRRILTIRQGGMEISPALELVIIKEKELSISETKREIVEKIKAAMYDGKDWIKMVEAAKRAGFSNMVSPQDFIDGKNQALNDLIKEIE